MFFAVLELEKEGVVLSHALFQGIRLGANQKV